MVRLPHAEDFPLPSYQTVAAAGLDLAAALPVARPLRLKPGARALVPTGLIIELPKGYEAQIRPRSGLAFKHGVTVLNAPGTIDADYRGEVQVLLVNLGNQAFLIERGERIAQMVVAPVSRVSLQEVANARATARGAGGFGSTGMRGESRNPASFALPEGKVNGTAAKTPAVMGPLSRPKAAKKSGPSYARRPRGSRYR